MPLCRFHDKPAGLLGALSKHGSSFAARATSRAHGPPLSAPSGGILSQPARLVPGTPVALDIHVVNDLRNRLRNAVVDAEISWSGASHRWRFGGDVDPDSVGRVGTLSWVVPDAAGLVTLTMRLSGPVEAVNRYDATIR